MGFGLVVALAACSGRPEASPVIASPASVAPAPTESQLPVASSTSAPEPLAPTASTSPEPTYASVAFATPSENIRCSLVSGPDGDGARCDISERDWAAPPKAGDCPLDWGNSLYLDDSGTGFGCVGDAIGHVDVLPYGQTETLGQTSCSSSSSGMRCVDLTTEHGFELARGSYSFF